MRFGSENILGQPLPHTADPTVHKLLIDFQAIMVQPSGKHIGLIIQLRETGFDLPELGQQSRTRAMVSNGVQNVCEPLLHLCPTSCMVDY
ncbi:MAG: hypothetical protein NDJ18_00985 [candidate division Zixibacteria bacterium]|nr:hypothetical protein [candidate division Zixibacteria bacterium]